MAAVDPVSAIANAAGALFGAVGSITTASIQGKTQKGVNKTSLLLASNPERRDLTPWGSLYIFGGLVLVLIIIVLFKIFS